MKKLAILLLLIPGVFQPLYARQCVDISKLSALRYWETPHTPYAEIDRYKHRERLIQRQSVPVQPSTPNIPKKAGTAVKASKKAKAVSGASVRQESALPADSGLAEKEQKALAERTRLEQARLAKAQKATDAALARLKAAELKANRAQREANLATAKQKEAEQKAALVEKKARQKASELETKKVVTLKIPEIPKEAVQTTKAKPQAAPKNAEPGWTTKTLKIAAQPKPEKAADEMDGNSWYPPARKITFDQAIRSHQ